MDIIKNENHSTTDEEHDESINTVASVDSDADTTLDNTAEVKSTAPVYTKRKLENDSHTAEESFLRKFFRFIFHTGVPSQCLRWLIIGFLLIITGFLLGILLPDKKLGMFAIYSPFQIIGIAMTGYSLILLTLNTFIVACHQRKYFYNWSFVHYASELVHYIAMMLMTGAVWIVSMISVLHPLLDSWIFGSEVIRSVCIKINITIFLTALFLAIKRHWITNLAMSFNYSNYTDRIKESLFADLLLSQLQKAKYTFKYREKWRQKHEQSLFRGTPSKPSEKSKRKLAAQLGTDVSKTQWINGAESVSNSVSSIFDLFPGNSNPKSDSIKASNNESSFSNFKSTKSTHTPAKASYHTESDTRRQFSEFSRLANKVTTRFSLLADYRVEIQAEAKRLSGKLFKYLRPYDRDYLLGQDLLPYLEDEEEFVRGIFLIRRLADGLTTPMEFLDAANYAFGLDELYRAIDGILTELYVTSKSLQTIETALGKIDSILTGVILFVMFVVGQLIVGSPIEWLSTFSNILAAAPFIFATSAKNMFESMIFLLIIHPFDVGDRVYIPLGTASQGNATTFATMAGDDSLDNLTVIETHLLSTVFERWDGVKLYVPNYLLAYKPIFNVRRSGALMECLSLQMNFSTSNAKIEELRKRLDEFASNDVNDFTDVTRLFIDHIENSNRLHVNIFYQHVGNWQELDTQMRRRSKMLKFLKDSFEILEITYLPPIQRVAILPADVNGESAHRVKEGDWMQGAEGKRLQEIINETRVNPV